MRAEKRFDWLESLQAEKSAYFIERLVDLPEKITR